MKILVGAAISDKYSYCFDEFYNSIKQLDGNFDVLLVDNSETDSYFNQLKEKGVEIIHGKYLEEPRDRMIQNRNILRDYMINNNYDYLLCLDSDIVLNKYTLKNLLNHKKEVISAVYFRPLTNKGKTGIVPLILEYDENKKLKLVSIEDKKVKKINMTGLGCILINKEVLKKISFRYDQGFDDEAFCQDLEKYNIPLYVDTSEIVKHLFLKRPWKWNKFRQV